MSNPGLNLKNKGMNIAEIASIFGIQEEEVIAFLS